MNYRSLTVILIWPIVVIFVLRVGRCCDICVEGGVGWRGGLVR